jgi:hypothetical protein
MQNIQLKFPVKFHAICFIVKYILILVISSSDHDQNYGRYLPKELWLRSSTVLCNNIA